jgi:hypothetical protein
LEGLGLGFLVKQLLLLKANFSPKVLNASNLRINGEILVPERGQLQFKLSQFLRLLLAIDVAFDKIRIGEFDLLVKY